MIKKETALTILAIAMVVTVGLLGFAPNVLAIHDYDNQFDNVEVVFNDTASVSMTEGGTYNTTVNQTSIIAFYVDTDVVYDDPDPNASEDFILCVIITNPVGEKEYIYGGFNGTLTAEPIPPTMMFYGAMIANETYNMTRNGTYTLQYEQWLVYNGTVTITDTFVFYIDKGVAPGESYDIYMGDWEYFEMGMGFIGVVGFIMTPVFTAKLMSSKDPIVLMSAFLICMIMFGSFIYVFLLGGS